MKNLFLLLLALIVSVGAASQNVWYADNSESPPLETTNSYGTKDNPFPYAYAFEGAGGRITSSDTVLFLAGAYNPAKVTGKFHGQVVFKPAVSGSVTFYSGINQVNQGGVINVDGATNITLQGFNVFGNNPNRNSLIGDMTGVGSGFNLLTGSNVKIIDNYVKDVTGSGIYLSSLCKDVSILYNLIKYVGYRSSRRRHHHGLYLQCDAQAHVLVKGNIISHSASYGVQVWQQANPRSQRSKINNVTFIDNIMFQAENQVLHYGGYNDTQNPVMIRNNIYNSVSGLGIRVGYTTSGPDNDVFGTHLSGNYIQGNLALVNPTDQLVSIDNNTVIGSDGGLFIHTFFENMLPGLLAKMDNNLLVTNNSKQVRLVDDDCCGEDGRGKRNYNFKISLDSLYTMGLPGSNRSIPVNKVKPNIQVVRNEFADQLRVAINNPTGEEKITLDLNGYFKPGTKLKVYDFENYTDPIQVTTDYVMTIDMNMQSMEPSFGNLDIDPKSDVTFACLIVNGPSKSIQSGGSHKPPTDIVIDPPVDTIPYTASFSISVKSKDPVTWIEVITMPDTVGSVKLRPHGSANWITENNPPYTFVIKDSLIAGTQVKAVGKVNVDVQLFSGKNGGGKKTDVETKTIDFVDPDKPDPNPDPTGDDEILQSINEKLILIMQLVDQQGFKIDDLKQLLETHENLIKLNGSSIKNLSDSIKNHTVEIELK